MPMLSGTAKFTYYYFYFAIPKGQAASRCKRIS